ncbi:MAG: thiamine pyrophosphate-dependent enzyme [Anaerolineales bacterium]
MAENKMRLNGDQAMAYGALTSGVRLVTSYPGSPGTGTVETLIELANEQGIYVEWSSNEKVAIEMGIGASIAGRRALVCVKSVGMNLMIDPLMVLNLTPVKGGLVILLGDDPGAYGSQNDQDTRQVTPLLELPILEPASPAEGYAMMREAFLASEKFQTPVIIRETRSFTQQVEPVSIESDHYSPGNGKFEREGWRFVPVPKNAVEKHRELHARLERLGNWTDSLPFNRIKGTGARGVVAAGFAYQKLVDLIGDAFSENFKVLKLSSIYPLPQKIVADFLGGCDEILVLEENEPFVETQIKVLAYDLGLTTKIFGKQSGHVVREGELYRWQIQESLSKFMPEFVPVHSCSQENQDEELPVKENYCAGAGYGKVLDALEKAAQSLNQELVLVGDPGCLVTIAERLDAKYAIGSAIGVADGMSKTGISERAVALFGDSAFFHTSLPALCNAVHNRSDILIVLLDNRSTASTGYQPHPGIAKDALGRETPGLSIEEIARACGVKHVYSIGSSEFDSRLVNLFQEVLGFRELTLVIAQTKHINHE